MEMNQSCCGIRGKFGMHGTFAYFSTRQLVTELRHRAHGSVFDTITRDTFTGVDVTCFRFPRTRSYDIFLYPFQFGSRVHRPKNESSRFRFLDERGFSTTQTSGQIEGRMGLETAEHHAQRPLGYRTGNGNSWTEKRVQHVRHTNGFPACPPSDQRLWITMQQAAAALGVSEMVVRRLIAQKILPAKQIVKFAPWMIERSHLDLPSVRKEIRRDHEGRRTGWAISEKQKGLFADTQEA